MSLTSPYLSLPLPQCPAPPTNAPLFSNYTSPSQTICAVITLRALLQHLLSVLHHTEHRHTPKLLSILHHTLLHSPKLLSILHHTVHHTPSFPTSVSIYHITTVSCTTLPVPLQDTKSNQNTFLTVILAKTKVGTTHT